MDNDDIPLTQHGAGGARPDPQLQDRRNYLDRLKDTADDVTLDSPVWGKGK